MLHICTHSRLFYYMFSKCYEGPSYETQESLRDQTWRATYYQAVIHDFKRHNGLSRLVWKNVGDLYGTLTSTPLSTIGLNIIWNPECASSTKLRAEWADRHACVEQSLPTRVRVIKTLNLEWEVQQAHICVKVQFLYVTYTNLCDVKKTHLLFTLSKKFLMSRCLAYFE